MSYIIRPEEEINLDNNEAELLDFNENHPEAIDPKNFN